MDDKIPSKLTLHASANPGPIPKSSVSPGERQGCSTKPSKVAAGSPVPSGSQCEHEEFLGPVFKPLVPLGSQCEHEESLGPLFEPRLYIQRYYFVQQQLIKYGVKSVVDLGSAECKISRFLVQIPTVRHIALVDIDGSLLESNKFAVRPYACDFLHKRENELRIEVYQGSATELDGNIVGFEAVSMVEIIEHLQPDILSAVCHMVFGDIQPKVVVMTTPNADYNVLFPGFTGFRHWDHKFEWNQKEFKCWCVDITEKYPYTLELSGIGDPPPDSSHLGYCSQAAIFIRKDEVPHTDTSNVVTHNYKLITESVYPHKPRLDSVTALQLELDYQLRLYRRTADDDSGLVPLTYLMKYKQIYTHCDINQLKEFLIKNGYNLTEDGCHIIPPSDTDSDYSSSDHDHSDLDHLEDIHTVAVENAKYEVLNTNLCNKGSKTDAISEGHKNEDKTEANRHGKFSNCELDCELASKFGDKLCRSIDSDKVGQPDNLHAKTEVNSSTMAEQAQTFQGALPDNQCVTTDKDHSQDTDRPNVTETECWD